MPKLKKGRTTKDTTLIQVKKITANKLKAMGKVGETYDDTINMLLDGYHNAA